MKCRTEQFPDIAVELVKAKVDVIFCAGDVAIRAAQQATATIPILAVTDDMVGSGLVRSLAQPGGNTTGVSILATELDGKRQEILIEAVPGLRRMAALADANTSTPRHAPGAAGRRRAHAASSFRSIGLPSPKRSCPQSTPRRLRMPQRSTCCRHRFSSPIAGSSSSTPRRCACLRCTNGRKWPRMAALSRTARASSRCFESWEPAPHQAIPRGKTVRSAGRSSRPRSSWSSISRPRRRSASNVPPVLLPRADEVIE